jgi:hypothetical protein
VSLGLPIERRLRDSIALSDGDPLEQAIGMLATDENRSSSDRGLGFKVATVSGKQARIDKRHSGDWRA